MVLKPQDVVVSVFMALRPRGTPLRYAEAAAALGMSRSEVHASVQRCLGAQLALRIPQRVDGGCDANRSNLADFLMHGVRYAFPPDQGGVTRGVPTAHSAPVLRERFVADKSSLPMVWPHPEGVVRGRAFSPIYRSVPFAAAQNPSMYAALALVDVFRGGTARDREIAGPLLLDLLRGRSGAETT